MGLVNENFIFEDQTSSVDILYGDDDMSIVSIDLFHVDGESECNRNDCRITKNAALKSLKSLFNKPILARYNSTVREFVTDVTEHAQNDKDLFNTRVVGHIPSDSRVRFIERDNGKTYCNVEAVLQKRYVPELMEILKKNDSKLKVSIEIFAKGRKEEDTGIFVIDSFRLQGVMCLGFGVVEGIENSHLEVLKFSKNEIDTMNKMYLSFSMQQKNTDDIIVSAKNKVFNLSVESLSEKLSREMSKYTYNENGFDYNRYFVEEIYLSPKELVVFDTIERAYYKVVYDFINGDVNIDMNDRVKVEKGWFEESSFEDKKPFVFAKEEYGVGEALKVDKSKNAMSDKSWGEVDKTELRHKVLNAKNYKSLVHDVYAEVEDGWEDSPSTKLKYPIMLIEGDTVVYARYGLSSALAYAKAEDNKSVIEKVEKLYKTMEIGEKEESMENSIQEIDNKLDEHNPEIEKIKDDADAMEDNEKEKLEEQVDNAVVDAPAEDKLKDDIDADKDYWKQKYQELEDEHNSILEKLNACETELNAFKAKEEKTFKSEYLDKFKMCFDEESLAVIASKVDSLSKDDFIKEVDDKVKEFVVKTFANKTIENETSDVEINNTCGVMHACPSTETKTGLDKVLEKFKK